LAEDAQAAEGLNPRGAVQPKNGHAATLSAPGSSCQSKFREVFSFQYIQYSV
jgi:hypothetical protein